MIYSGKYQPGEAEHYRQLETKSLSQDISLLAGLEEAGNLNDQLTKELKKHGQLFVVFNEAALKEMTDAMIKNQNGECISFLTGKKYICPKTGIKYDIISYGMTISGNETTTIGVNQETAEYIEKEIREQIPQDHDILGIIHSHTRVMDGAVASAGDMEQMKDVPGMDFVGAFNNKTKAMMIYNPSGEMLFYGKRP